MEKIIKKWATILSQDKGKGMVYSRTVLKEMLEDFKKAIKNCNIPDVSNSVCQDYMHIHYARYCDYDYCPSCGKHIKTN
jgi:hypothetical protein